MDAVWKRKAVLFAEYLRYNPLLGKISDLDTWQRLTASPNASAKYVAARSPMWFSPTESSWMPVFPIVSTPKRLESAGNQTESSHERTSNGKETIPGFDMPQRLLDFGCKEGPWEDDSWPPCFSAHRKGAHRYPRRLKNATLRCKFGCITAPVFDTIRAHTITIYNPHSHTLVDLNCFIKKRALFFCFFLTCAKLSRTPCLSFVGNNASYEDSVITSTCQIIIRRFITSWYEWPCKDAASITESLLRTGRWLLMVGYWIYIFDYVCICLQGLLSHPTFQDAVSLSPAP